MSKETMEITLICGGRDCSGQILGVTVTRELGRIPFMSVSLKPEDGGKASAFKQGADVELKAGPGGKVQSVFKGVLTGMALSRRGSETLLELEVRDEAYVLAQGQNTTLFLNKNDSDICREIISRAGLTADIPGALFSHKQMQQIMTSDWDFILSRLWANAMVASVRDGKITAEKAENLGSNIGLELDAERDVLLELEVRQDARAWLGAVTVRSWDESSQIERRKKVRDTMPKLAGGAEGNGEATQELLLAHRVEPDELEGLGTGLLWRARHGFVHGRVRLSGMVDAQPGDGLRLKNISELADGESVIWGSRLELRSGDCTHELQFGYDFFDRLCEGLGQTGKNGLSGWLSGDLPHVSGLFPGKVLRISGDPEEGERIQVHIPLLHEEDKGVWARWAAPYAGDGYAMVFRPEKGNEVLVGFLGGDPRAPVILGALPSRAALTPKPLRAESEKNSPKGWVSKSGLTLLLNEEHKSVTIETPGGQSLVIDDKIGSIVLKDKNSNTVTLDKNGIALKSGKDLILEAKGNVSIKATQNFNAEGLDASIQGKKAIKLGGTAMAELTAGGPLRIKGGLVTIN